MSVLYLATELETLAARLAEALLHDERHRDCFSPVTIVVPNRYLRKWLRLWLARRTGIAINLRFDDLEDALWALLRAVDPHTHATPPEPLDDNTYRLLVLSVLLEDRESNLGLLRGYMQLSGPTLTRLSCRRAWQLADRLGMLIREYEYHRQDRLIQPWLRQQSGLPLSATRFDHFMERAQRSLFANITRAGDGKRAWLAQLSGRNFKTFPQYAVEVMDQPLAVRQERTVHCFGLTQTCELHARALAWLGRAFDLRIYHPNVHAGRLGAKPCALDLHSMHQSLDGDSPDNEIHGHGQELLRAWGRGGAESLALIAPLLEGGAFTAERLERPVGSEIRQNSPGTVGRRRRNSGEYRYTVLGRFQERLLGRPSPLPRRLPQDTSLQIVACPGMVREVETVYNSILANLHRDPSLRQTDFAVLVSDMPRYRPILQAVFERPPQHLQYNLVDFSAAGLSMLGQALCGMLDLALESFTRARVFAVLLNPCFLARFRIDRAQALTWLEWAETLGVYQGWDASEKHEQGYPRSPFYAWRVALQRLRLGRYMEVAPEDGDAPAPRFGHVIPFADIHSTDREHLDAFCRAVETLLPTLAKLRNVNGSGQRWASALERLVLDFLDVPPDRPEEQQVRDEILAALERLPLWDHLRPGHAPPTTLPLALVREYVQTQLEALEGSRGEYLTGGVTLAALEPARPVPFPVIYVIGLDAESFPGSNALSSFDLRGVERAPGDIRPAEERTYVLLENLLAAQQKIYLLYNNYDASQDRAILPSVPVQQLARCVGEQITRGKFAPVEMPLTGDADAFFNEAAQPEYQDVLVQYRESDRFLALSTAAIEGRLLLDLHQGAELQARTEAMRVDFAVAPDPAPGLAAPITVAVAELQRFLRFPARETLRRHLRIDDADEPAVDDEEPLVTSDGAARQLVRQTLSALLRRAMAGESAKALEEWPDRFRAAFADGRLRSRVPEDAFGDIDEAGLRRELTERIHGRGGLEPFLRARSAMTTCGPALLGQSVTPVGAKMRFPALQLPRADGPETRIVGSTPFAWFNRDTFEVLVITTAAKINANDLGAPMLEPLLLYLALLANPDPNVKRIAAKDWLSRRHFLLHVACPDGIQTWTHPIGLIAPDEALRYMEELTRDFLDPTQLDLLPFDLVAGTPLRRVYDERSTATMSAEVYQQTLEEKLTEQRENPFQRTVQIPLVVDMAGARVPVDALAKVQRRFGLLDRAAALNRYDGVPGRARIRKRN
jgi:exodeoxyribonuclease V gamma subunit